MTKVSGKRRELLALCALAAASPAVLAQASKRSVKVVVPYPPGGSVDVVARILSERLSELMNRSFVVENKSGAGGNIASRTVAQSSDGTTVLLTSNNHTISPSLYADPGYDALRDFSPIGGIGAVGFAFVAHPSTGIKSLDELIAKAKAAPNTVFFGTGGNGHPAHMAAELLMSRAGIQMQHVPYKGTGPLTNDILGGQIPVAVISVTAAVPVIQAGKLNGLAVTSGQRWPAISDVPAVAEFGLGGYDYSAWVAMFAPRNMPAEEVAAIENSLLQALAEVRTQRLLGEQGLLIKPSDSRALQKFVEQDLELNRTIIERIGLKI